MGQAKRRGTFEQRRDAAIIKAGIEREEKRRREIKRRASMTAEQKQKERDAAVALAYLLSVSATFPYSIRLLRGVK